MPTALTLEGKKLFSKSRNPPASGSHEKKKKKTKCYKKLVYLGAKQVIDPTVWKEIENSGKEDLG